MPFDPVTGTFTFTDESYATGAFAGEVITSAGWNQIHTDIETALTQLGQGQLNDVYAPRIITVNGNITVAATDRLILIGATVSVITLPASLTKLNPVTIIGNGAGFFSVHNSVLTPDGAELIDGLATLTLITDYQSITLVPLEAGGWLIA